MNNVYIVDGQKAVGQMLAESLAKRDFEIVGSSNKISTALPEILELRPKLLILEMVLPDGLGHSLIERVRAVLPTTRFVIFSDNKESDLIKAGLQAGVHGFVEKSVDFSMFLNAINIVVDGGCFFGFNITEVLRSVVTNKSAQQRPKDNLTDREREVLRMIAEGDSNKEIASKLKLSVKTVDNHRCSMMRKLKVHNVAAITLYAVEHRLVNVKFAL